MSKFGFVHRTLWQREHAYRWAALLGPPPLIGCAVAALVWMGVLQFSAHSVHVLPGSGAPWARWTRPVVQNDQPVTEVQSAPLPRSDAAGRTAGLTPGWNGGIQPITVDATMDVNVIATSLGSFMLDQPTIPLARVLDAGPARGLFVGTGRAFFIIRSAGLYAFSARLTRAGTQSADCIVRLASAHHRILRNIVLGAAGNAVLDFPPTEFRLDPGLYLLQLAVGCWRGDVMDGSGELALMVRHPGDTALQPAAADELLRRASHEETNAAAGAAPAAK